MQPHTGQANTMLRAVFLATILAAAAPCSPLQDDQSKPAQPEIRGTVTELGTHAPVPDVEVAIYRWPDAGPRVQGPRHEGTVTVRTGVDGVFQMQANQLGDYSIEIAKEGWSAAAAFNMSLETSAEVSLTKAHPSREVKFQMARPGELSGRVLDFETGKPVGNLHVGAVLTMYSGRQRSALSTSHYAATGEDGRFVVQGLTPGDYVVQVRRTGMKESGLRLEFAKKDLATVEHGYQESLWPGGGDMLVAAPVQLGSGAHVSVGEIAAKKVPIYRIHGSIAAGGCVPGEMATLREGTQGFGVNRTYDLGNLPCGKEFLLVGREPGTYWLHASVSTAGRRAFGFVPVTITDKNVEAAIVLGPGVAVDVKYVVTEGSRPADLKSVRLMMLPLVSTGVGANLPEPPDADGRLHLAGLALCDQKVTIFGLSKGFYVKELRYNGSALPGKVVPLNGEAMAHNLEVVLDDKPAAISGVVSDGDRRVARAGVVLIKCPLTDAAFAEPLTALANDRGRFQIGGLVPGTYRLFAVEREAVNDIRNFAILERMLKSAKEVTLDANGFQDVTLELADLRK